MTNSNQFHATRNIAHQNFEKKVEQLRQQSRSFTGLVRMLYGIIEQAIRDDVPLEVLLATINEQHGTAGSMSGFKSALYRIRKEVDARRTLGLALDPNVALDSGHANSTHGGQPYTAPAQHQFVQPMQLPPQHEQPNMTPYGQPVHQWAPQPSPMYTPYNGPSLWDMFQPQGGHRPMY